MCVVVVAVVVMVWCSVVVVVVVCVVVVVMVVVCVVAVVSQALTQYFGGGLRDHFPIQQYIKKSNVCAQCLNNSRIRITNSHTERLSARIII